MSSEFGLKAAPSTATRLPSSEPLALLAGQVDDAGPAAHVDRVDLLQEGQRLVGAQLAGAGHERADVLGQAAAAEAEARRAGSGRRCARRRTSASASCMTSAPAASQTSAIALMKEILVARKALAATLTSSAVGEVGDHHRHALGQQRRVDLAQLRLGRGRRATPMTSRSGCSVSWTAKPSRRNSGFQASSALGAARRTAAAIRAAVPDRDGRLADHQRRPRRAGVRQAVDRGVDVGDVGGVLALALRGADADEVHVAVPGPRGQLA